MAIHKGTELNNVKETWQQNEQARERENMERVTVSTNDEGDDLEQTIKEEAAEYDNANKEDRLLSGDRATVRDDENDPGE